MENIIKSIGWKREAITWNKRVESLVVVAFCLTLFSLVFISAMIMDRAGLETNLAMRKLMPSFDYPMGTDSLGRDMLVRTVKGLSLSLRVGLTAAFYSAAISCLLGFIAACGGRWVDSLITGLVDLFMSMPHIVLLILLAFVMGGGEKGVIIAVAVSHWPRLSRVIRAEIYQLKTSEYISISRKMGKSGIWIVRHHMLDHITAQFIVGLTLLVPHAILHSAGLTFLGFGLSPHNPSIGILLSESMRHLSTGCWWLAIFPGLTLVTVVMLFDIMGSRIRQILNPKTRQE